MRSEVLEELVWTAVLTCSSTDWDSASAVRKAQERPVRVSPNADPLRRRGSFPVRRPILPSRAEQPPTQQSMLERLIATAKRGLAEIGESIQRIAGRQQYADPDEPELEIEADDTALYQRASSARKGREPQRERYVLTTEQPVLNVAKLYSYFGSGVVQYGETQLPSELAATPEFTALSAPTNAGAVVQYILAEAVLNTGGRLDPETKERFLFWMQLAEGKVWRAFYECAAAIRTRDYDFNKVS